MFGGRKNNVTTTSQETTLYVMLSASGYRIRSPGQKTDLRRDVPADPDLSRVEQLERVFADAASHVADRTAKKIENVALLIDSPLVLVRDPRDQSLASVSDARAREVGAQLLSCRESSFGKTRFATAGSRRGAQDVYAFIDLNHLKQLLAALDQLAVQTREIIPLPYLLMRRALASGQAVFCAIHVGGEDTTVMLAEPQSSTVVDRHLPVGINTIVRAVAAAQSVNIKEALTGLSRRNYFQDLPVSETEQRSDVSLGTVEAALAGPVRALLADIRESLDFLGSQLGIEPPPVIELMGDAEKLPGFDHWLTDALADQNVQTGVGELFDDFVFMERDSIINLLSGSAGGLFSVGKLTYEYRNNQFVAAESSASGQSNVPRALQSRAASRRNRRKGGLLSRLTSSGEAGARRSVRGGGDTDGPYRMGAWVLFLAVLYFGYGAVETVAKRHTLMAAQYMNMQQRLFAAESGGALPGAGASGASAVVSDKVLWGEKFYAIGKHINNNLWLTDVFVTKGSTSGEGQQLIIRGAALPSHKGHIQRISCFARALTNDRPDDRPGFMTDFREIAFGGSRFEGTGDADSGIVTFELSATYLGRSQKSRTLSTAEQAQLDRKMAECAADSAAATGKDKG